jgi:hypothetical protein
MSAIRLSHTGLRQLHTGASHRDFEMLRSAERAGIAALPLIQLRLSSLTLAKAPHPSPARGEGK